MSNILTTKFNLICPCGEKIVNFAIVIKDETYRIDYGQVKNLNTFVEVGREYFSGEIESLLYTCPNCGDKEIKSKDIPEGIEWKISVKCDPEIDVTAAGSKLGDLKIERAETDLPAWLIIQRLKEAKESDTK